MTREEAQSALETVAKIKAAPEYKTLTDDELKILQEKENRYRAVATGQEGRIRAGELKPKGGMRKAAEAVGETATDVGGTASSVGRQALGMGAALAQNIPGFVPGVEAVGDLGQELLRGHPTAQSVAGTVFPPSGSSERAVQNAPSPTQARVFGALSPMASAAPAAQAPGLVTRAAQAVTPQIVQRGAQAVGGAVNTAMTPANLAYQAVQRGAAKLPMVGPGTSHAIAGATTGAGIGAVDAGLRRVAPAVTGQDVPSMDWYHEVVIPGMAGLVGASIPGVHNMMTRKGFQPTEGSEIANKFVEVKQSGREQNRSDPIYGTPRGNIGMEKVAERGRQHVTEAKTRGDTALAVETEGRAAAKAGAERGWEGRLARGERGLANRAAEVEPQVRRTLLEQDKANRNAFANEVAQYESDPIPEGDLFLKMRDTISTKAKSSSAGTQDEEYLPAGEHLRDLWGTIEKYVAGGTVRDYRNAISDLKTVANSGTPERAWVASQLVGGLKDHLKASHAGIANAYANYRISQKNTGRALEITHGEEDPHNLGQRSPDPDDPYIEVKPSQEIRARKRLANIGDASPDGLAREPAVEELESQGLSGPIGEMREARAGLNSLESAKERAMGNIDAVTRRRKAELESMAEQDATSAEADATEALEAKHAVEMSQFPSFTETLQPVAQAATAITSHNPAHALPVGAMAGASLMRRAGQFVQSNVARGLDPLQGPGIPVGFASQVAAGEDSAKRLVSGAREHANRLKASLGEIARKVRR